MVASTSELRTLFASLDGNADGRISAAELGVCMRATLGEDIPAAEAEALWRRWTRTATGCWCITPASLGRMLGKLGNERAVGECRAMICRFDLDGDGVLSFDEFKIMMSA
ncbi:hypothetical protein QYE76_018714 [Lolium multiflorum]|uniref:EF-hand domain-containing protein n=1 Tax=Lolium multiflorum TaxID=4521 RepID=A0AAD8VC82_LOLMU|nr:hypothetical protein QYE76_018714 [Lolium multiflorum]